MMMMERPDRLRGLPYNPAPGRRFATSGPSNASNVLPSSSSSLSGQQGQQGLRHAHSNPNLSASQPLSSTQVLALVRDSMRQAHDAEAQAAAQSGVANGLRPGLTVDLSRRKIQKLPEEVVDIIKDELERLALSHNCLQTFPARFSECTSLRYLNIRQNKIREFPLALCDLKSLEILDLGRNMLQSLPPEIVKLSSLKVFSIPKNYITELPLCIADLPSLSVIKLEGNPLVFPPPEVLQTASPSMPSDGAHKDNELSEVSSTAQIKKFLRLAAIFNMSANGGGGRGEADASDDPNPIPPNEPTRFPLRRNMSGRFPVKVNGTDIIADLRSPALQRPPPIPSRSHYRGLSQQNAAQRRPGVMPLTIGNPNERLRSNSETLLQAARVESRNRRMGIVSKKPSDLITLDETQANNRFSHYRGLSDGSAMQGSSGTSTGVSMAMRSPASPVEPFAQQRPVYIRRLSILPERRRESKVFDPVLEAAKGILYSVFQIHPMIQMLMSLASDGISPKRSSLEIVFYNTGIHVEELEAEIMKHETPGDDDAEERGHSRGENENVQRACTTLVSAYNHVCSLLVRNVDLFVENGDPRYIRTLLTQLYNSTMELRVTCAQVVPASGPGGASPRRGAGAISAAAAVVVPAAWGDTIKPHSRENSLTPQGLATKRNGNFVYNPSNLRVATDVPLPSAPLINGSGRTATIKLVTPRSGESFASGSSVGRNQSLDFSDEDRAFERIYLSLQKSSELVMRILPTLNAQFQSALRVAAAHRAPEHNLQCWKALIARCNISIQQTEMLRAKLSNIKLKEPGIRNQSSFWNLCNAFVDSWCLLVKRVQQHVKDQQRMSDMQLPMDTKVRLRPIQQSMKETLDLMLSSPWSYMLRQSTLCDGVPSSFSTHISSSSSLSNPSVPMPMTPQNAALGPAVQATVPSTPQSASFAAAFSGNVFERADALISMGGLSISSRSGTMNSTSASSFGSFSSTISSQDGVMTPPSMLSPVPSSGPVGPLPFRLNNGSKVGF